AAPIEPGDFEDLHTDAPDRGQAIHLPGPRGPATGKLASFAPRADFAEYEAVPLDGLPGSGRGVFLGAGALAVAFALLIILLGLAFFLGLLVGKSYYQ